MTVSNAQVRKLMEEMSKHGEIGRASMKADLDRKTARKYVVAEQSPLEKAEGRTWLTRKDVFSEHRVEVENWLRDTPGLEAKTLLSVMIDKYPECFNEGHLRTLQRRVQRWRTEHGPEKNIFLAQQHRPGEAAQTDFTWATELGITVGGETYDHMLCVFVLPYSNWQWATACASESIAAIRRGVQRALFQLGRVPQFHQTDNSTAATHRIPDRESAELNGVNRRFNDEYLALMRHFDMTPRTTEVGAKEQNGDVEASNRALKRRLEQALLIRGSREFASVEEWQTFVDGIARKANKARGPRVAEDIEAMRELNVSRLPEFVEQLVRVSDWSTVRIKGGGYSVPSRLIGERVRARIYEDKIEIYFANRLELSCERLHRKQANRIDYRHVIWSLVRKPGAFARYVYREQMFPTLVFRCAYDAIKNVQQGTKGDLEYLRILHLAATTMEADVEAALDLLLAEKKTINSDTVKILVASRTSPQLVPDLECFIVDLSGYDALLVEVGQ